MLTSFTGNINGDKFRGYDSLDTCVCWRPSGVAALLPVVEATPVYKKTHKSGCLVSFKVFLL